MPPIGPFDESASAALTSVSDARLPSARERTSAVFDGQYAFVFGGRNEAGYLDDILKYDSATGTVVKMRAVLPRGLAATSAVWTGRYAFIFGGLSGESTQGALEKRILRYDPQSDALAIMGATLPAGLEGTMAVWDGRHAHVIGGRTLGLSVWDRIVRYDPARDEATLASAKLPRSISYGSAVWDGDGATVFGGVESDPVTRFETPLSSILRYDPVAEVVSTLTNTLPSARQFASAVFDGSDAYVFGGRNATVPLSEVLRIGPAATDVSVMDVSLPSDVAAASAVWDGEKATIFGGFTEGAANGTRLLRRSIIEYDPSGSPASIERSTAIASLNATGAASTFDSFIEGARSLSVDGRYLVFTSYEPTLVAGSDASGPQVYLRDMETGQNFLVSATVAGKAGNGVSEQPAVSAGGRYVVFVSNATDLVTGDSNGKRDVFVRDMAQRSTSLVSASAAGSLADGDSYEPVVSSEGQIVAFYSYATNLVPGDTNSISDVFVVDRGAKNVSRISVGAGGLQSDGGSFAPAISSDGRYVAFRSTATNIVTGRSSNIPGIFVTDRLRGTTALASVATDGTQANDFSFRPSISGDGRYVAFESDATNLVPDDTNRARDIFIRDASAGTTRLVTVSTSQAQADGASRNAAISTNGRIVAFESDASNLVGVDEAGLTDVYVRDLDNLTTEAVSVSTSDATSDDDSSFPSVSGNGRYVAFTSKASTLAPGNGDHARNVFIRDRSAQEVASWLTAAPDVPVLTVSPATADGKEGWYRTTPTVTLSGGARERIMVSLDGGSSTMYEAPLTIGEGSHSLVFYAVSGAGVRSAAGRFFAAVDSVGPSLSDVSVEPESPVQGAKAFVNVSASDATSGAVRIEGTLEFSDALGKQARSTIGLVTSDNVFFSGGFVPSSTGRHVLTLVAFDEAGNSGNLSTTFDVSTAAGVEEQGNGTEGDDVTGGNDTIENGTSDGTGGDEPGQGGTVEEYSAAYAAGESHDETYTEERRDAELVGAAGEDYIQPTGGRASYLQGSITGVLGSDAAEDLSTGFENAIGVETAFADGTASQGVGETKVEAEAPKEALVAGVSVDLSHADLRAGDVKKDEAAPGLLAGEKTVVRDGTEMWRRFALLEGTLHSDSRTRVRVAGSEKVTITGEIALEAPAGSWLATEEGGRVRAVPVSKAGGLVFQGVPGENRWFSVYNPATTDVAGVVLSGSAPSVTLRVDGTRLIIVPERSGAGEVLAAEYLLAYKVADLGATRYAGIMELAREDSEEVGVAFIATGRHGANGWAGSRAALSISAEPGEAQPLDQSTVSGTWRLVVDASSENGGKTLRTIMPAGFMDVGGLDIELDGVAVNPLGLGGLTDGETLILTFPIPHFSERTVVIRTVLPGVPSFFLWLTLGLGLVAGGEGALLLRMTLRSRAAARGLGEPTSRGPRSEAVQRALGKTPPSKKGSDLEAEGATPPGFKSETLRRMQERPTPPGDSPRARYARCRNCDAPIMFEAGAVSATCDSCGAQNVNEPT